MPPATGIKTGRPRGTLPVAHEIVDHKKQLIELEKYVRRKYDRPDFTIMQYASDLLFSSDLENHDNLRWVLEYKLKVLEFMARYNMPQFRAMQIDQNSTSTTTNLDVDVSGLLKQVLQEAKPGYVMPQAHATDAEFDPALPVQDD